MNISELKNKDTNSEVTNLMGWVSSVRDHGNLIFIELRDTDSRIQLVLDAEKVELDTFKSVKFWAINITLVLEGMDLIVFINLSTPNATPIPDNFPNPRISDRLSYLPPPPTTVPFAINSKVKSL